MKLCYIANGSSIHTNRWIQPFIEAGSDVVVLSYTHVESPLAGCRTIDLTALTNIPKLRFILWGLWVRKFVRTYRPDLLHAHQIQAAGWLGYLANYHPFIVSTWGSDLLIEPKKSKLRFRLVKMVLKRCDRLTVPSPMMYTRARELGVTDNQLRTIPWGIETDIFRPLPTDRNSTRAALGIDEVQQVVFCPRSIQPIYQIHTLLEAIRNLRQRYPKILCLLLKYNVSSAYLSQLKETVQKHQLDGQVRWLPMQNSLEEMARLYRAADIMVSIPASEGYGFSVYESMACGCPTIITDLPAFHGDLVNGISTLTVPCGDVLATSKAIGQVLEDQTLRIQLIKNGVEIGQRRSIKLQAADALNLYRELAGTT